MDIMQDHNINKEIFNNIYDELKIKIQILELIKLYEIELNILSNKIKKLHKYINYNLIYKKNIIVYINEYKYNINKLMIYSFIINIIWLYLHIYNIYIFLLYSIILIIIIYIMNIYLLSNINNNIDINVMKLYLTNTTEIIQLNKIIKKNIYLSKNYRDEIIKDILFNNMEQFKLITPSQINSFSEFDNINPNYEKIPFSFFLGILYCSTMSLYGTDFQIPVPSNNHGIVKYY